MTQLTHINTNGAGPDTHVFSVSDLLVPNLVPGSVYSINQGAGGVIARSVGAALNPHDTKMLPVSAVGLQGPMGLLEAEIGLQTRLVAHGQADRLTTWAIDAGNGQLSDQIDLVLSGAGTLLAVATVIIGAQTYFFTSARDVPGVSVWRLETATQAEAIQTVPAGLSEGNDVFSLNHVRLGDLDYLLAVGADAGEINVLRILPDGQLSLAAQTGLRDGLAISTPTLLETVTVGETAYVLVGAAGTSSVTVFAMEPDGGLVPTDQVNDDLATRFQNISVLKAVTLDDRIYVVAGGADDGLTLMELLPNGRLLHRETIADDLEMTLTNPGGLTLRAHDAGIDIFAAGQGTSPGVTQLRFEPGMVGEVFEQSDTGGVHEGTAGNDTLIGGAGDDWLNGRAGDDVLIDGAGIDRLRGDNGADVFILIRDGQTDRIEDYERGVDRIDLSRLGLFFSVDALEIQSTNWGAAVDIGGERTEVRTADGSSLQASDLNIADLRDLWHLDVAARPDLSLMLEGGTSNDTLIGGSGDDVINGMSGKDRLNGEAGNDTILGEALDSEFDEMAAHLVRLYQSALDRAPDPGGHLNWVNVLRSGSLTLEEVATRFVGSAEFQVRYGNVSTSAEFVTLLYNNVLGRAPDPVGFDTWVRRMDEEGLSRTDVVLGFSESSESVRLTQVQSLEFSRAGYQAEWSDDVFRLYQAAFDRAPDPIGFFGWTSQLANGRSYEDVVGGFVNSREFQTLYGDIDDPEFVTLLYNNVLARASDAVGFADWVNRLESGAWTRTEVIAGFAQSAEFIRNSSDNLTAWMRNLGIDDVLLGGTGNNVLFGGILSDSFVFTPWDEGRHEVAGFEPWDQLDFSAFEYQSKVDLRAQFINTDDGLVFSGEGVEVVVHGMFLVQLSDDMLVV